MKQFYVFLTLIALTQGVFAQLPVNSGGSQNAYAIVIGNENYQTYGQGYVENATKAILDAERFKQFLIKEKQYKEKNVFFITDATNGGIKLLLTKLKKLHPTAKIKHQFYLPTLVQYFQFSKQ